MEIGLLHTDEFDFAKDALGRISVIAADLGQRENLYNAARLGADLFIACQALGSADSSRLPRIKRRLPKLLNDLERICTLSNSSDPQRPILRSVVQKRFPMPEVEERIRKGISAFVKADSKNFKDYLKLLRRFSKSAMRKHREHNEMDATVKTNAEDEYPTYVTSALYSVLQEHSACTCIVGNEASMPNDKHAGRLRLRSDVVKVDGDVTFDMLFSASPNSWEHWQDLQFMVPIRHINKRVKYTPESTTKASSRREIEQYKVVSLGTFCNIVGARAGSRIRCRVQESTLYQLYDGAPIVQHADAGPSIPLRDILDSYRLSNRMKLVLAYIISWSFWQYYDSPWMNTKWSSDTIHFLPSSRADEGDIETLERATFHVSKPYFVTVFTNDSDITLDYCDAYSAIYRHPRLLVLCITLLEICRGQSLLAKDTGFMEADLNKNWELAKRILNKSKSSEEFPFPHYYEAIENLLSQKLFTECQAKCSASDIDIKMRKAIIYKTIIAPLQNLLNVLGFADNIYSLDPIGLARRGSILSIPEPNPVQKTQNEEELGSLQWLDKLTQVNNFIYRQSLKEEVAGTKRITIAILDTGYDKEAIFFGIPGRKERLKGWRDLVGSSEDPIDESGHGTYTVALAMKVAPMADIYVARIAKDRTNLNHAAEHIGDAIKWAIYACNVDIVSMSFGFHHEISSISRVIHEAELRRNKRILFFAAASNSGANCREMFPASDDSVISIRQTNCNGAFSDTNPPADPNGPVVYGTLGKQVPSAWLHNMNGEISKSGSSVSTVVAAGIAAMILQFANIYILRPEFRQSSQVEKLWTRAGILAIFAKISQNMGNRCFFISPIKFFSERNAMEAWAAMVDACS